MDVPHEGLLAAVDEFHGAVRVQSQHGPVDLHGQVLASAEGAPDPREVDAHAVRRQPEAGRDLVAVDVQPLRCDVDVDAALAVGNGQPGLRAEERLVPDAELVRPFDDHVRLGVGVAVADDHMADDIRARVLQVAVAVGPALRVDRLHFRGALGVDDRLERLVLDPHLLGRAPRLLRVLGRDDRNGLAVIADAVEGEHGLVGELEAVALLAGNVLVREHRVDARHADRPGRVDGGYERVRMWAPDGVAPEHVGRVEVARVGELACDLGNRVDPAHGLAHAPELELAFGRAHGASADTAAARTASKIFW